MDAANILRDPLIGVYSPAYLHERLRETKRAPRPPSERGDYDQSVAPVRAQLEGADFDLAGSLGQGLTPAQASALALGEETGTQMR